MAVRLALSALYARFSLHLASAQAALVPRTALRYIKLCYEHGLCFYNYMRIGRFIVEMLMRGDVREDT